MENKYFTPNIEDLFIGYECEVNWEYFTNSEKDRQLPQFSEDASIKVSGWRPLILKGVDEAVKKYHSKGLYRTPYLTKEQIEVEGWTVYTVISMDADILWGGTIMFAKGEYFIQTTEQNIKRFFIFKKGTGRNSFDGTCPSINEFRKLLKLLGI